MSTATQQKLPSITTKVVTPQGNMTNVWHRFFNLFAGATLTVPANPGIVVYNGTDFINRTITAGSDSIEITNGTGVSGNIEVDVGDIAATELTGTLGVDHGGTGATSFTPYTVICAGNTATGVLSNVTSVGTSGYVLTSNGAGTLPTFQAPSSTQSRAFPFFIG